MRFTSKYTCIALCYKPEKAKLAPGHPVIYQMKQALNSDKHKLLNLTNALSQQLGKVIPMLNKSHLYRSFFLLLASIIHLFAGIIPFWNLPILLPSQALVFIWYIYQHTAKWLLHLQEISGNLILKDEEAVTMEMYIQSCELSGAKAVYKNLCCTYLKWKELIVQLLDWSRNKNWVGNSQGVFSENHGYMPSFLCYIISSLLQDTSFNIDSKFSRSSLLNLQFFFYKTFLK